jgi:hypothetical protein
MIPADGGVFIRVIWPNDGPSAHFSLAEIFTARIRNLFQAYSRLYGAPKVCAPAFGYGLNEPEMKKAA